MNPRTSLTLIGILLIIIGLAPVIATTVKLEFMQSIPETFSLIYQGIIVFIGIIPIFLSGKKKESKMPFIIQHQ